ncbi:hypothetical protein KR009_010279 [Drosophila setifemur]|nr:hypothetical protein KR009_010279 [Drosophila setifemur]
MLQYLLVYFVLLNRRDTKGCLCVTKVIVRVPREKDIGLIFGKSHSRSARSSCLILTTLTDLTVTNRIKGVKRETLDFVVTSDGECTVNTTQGDVVRSVGRIFGGDFGAVEPGKSETVSLVWPTVSLYNRVGSCPISITTTNAQDAMATTRQLLLFDTRFETLDPKSHTLRKRRHFVDCHNWDKDYLRNCTPLNCEERYFGQRSFYNLETNQCEPVPACSETGQFYDPFSNEGVDSGDFVSEEDLELIKLGKFDSNYLHLRRPLMQEAPILITSPHSKKTDKPSEATVSNIVPTEDCDKSEQHIYLTLADFNDCFQHLTEENKKLIKKSPFEVPLLTQFYYDWFLPLRSDTSIRNEPPTIADAGNQPSPPNVPSGSEPLSTWLFKLDFSGWLLLILRGSTIILLLITFQICVTLTAYFLVCLAVYGIMELYTMCSSVHTSDILISEVGSRSSSYDVVTTESLLSQR